VQADHVHSGLTGISSGGGAGVAVPGDKGGAVGSGNVGGSGVNPLTLTQFRTGAGPGQGATPTSPLGRRSGPGEK